MQAVTEGSLIILLYQGVIYVWIGVIYLISGFGGRVLSSLFIRSSISVGASGALFGLLGAMLSELLTNWTIYTNKTHQAKAREHQQQLQLQQMQFMQQRHVQLQRGNPNHPSLNGLINTLNSDGILGGLSTASVLSTKMYAEELKNPHSMDSEAFTQLLDASRMALLKSASNHPRSLKQAVSPG